MALNRLNILNRLNKISTIGGGINWITYWNKLLASPNSDIVQWNGINPITTGTPFLSGLSSGVGILVKYKGERVTGARNITQVSFHNKTTTRDRAPLLQGDRRRRCGCHDRD